MTRMIAMALLIAGAAGGGSCAMPKPCFTRYDPVLPAREKVRPRLSHGELGRRIYDAVVAGDAEAVRGLAAQDPALLTTAVRMGPGEEGYAGNDGDLLTFAVAGCDSGMVALLLELGAAPDGVRPGTSLSYALLADTPDMAELLLAAGASPDPVAPDQRAPFTDALLHGNVGAVRMLVRHGLAIDRTDALGETYLLEAAGVRAFRIMEVLVAAGANPWRIGMGGAMAVHAIATPGAEAGEEAAARERLVALTHKSAPAWPPPSAGAIRDMVTSGALPQTSGMVAAPEIVARLRDAKTD